MAAEAGSGSQQPARLQRLDVVREAQEWLRAQATAITALQVRFAQLPSPDLRAVPRAQLFELVDTFFHGFQRLSAFVQPFKTGKGGI